jgi:hypothetical protein
MVVAVLPVTAAAVVMAAPAWLSVVMPSLATAVPAS